MADTFAGDILPSATGLNLGSSTQRWDLFAQNIDASGVATLNVQSVNGIYFANQYATIAAAITAAGTTGTVVIPSIYTGGDSYTNTNSIPILDLRGGTYTSRLNSGLIITGTADKAVFRTDASLEIMNSVAGHALLSIFQTQNPTTNEEAAITFGGYNSAGVAQKMTSISAMWANNDATSGYGVIRLNAAYYSGGLQQSDIALRIFGNNGIYMFGPSDTTVAGANVLRVNGRILSLYGDVRSVNDGSDTAGAGAFFALENNAETRKWLMQLSASNDLAYHYYNGASWSKIATLYNTGQLESTWAFWATKDGSDSALLGAHVLLRNTAGTRYWVTQLGASNDYNWWYYNGTTVTKYATMSTAGRLNLVGGLQGTTTNDSASAGSVGEYQTATTAAATTSLTSDVSANATSVSLTAGDWDVDGVVNYTFDTTTSYTNLAGGISTTSATLGSQDTYFDYSTSAIVPTAAKVMAWVVPTRRISISGTTTVYLVAQGTFTTSFLKVGGTITARRVR